ncbi:MAG: MBL fold metallo-hydrolase [Gemmatimonadales bacterium]
MGPLTRRSFVGTLAAAATVNRLRLEHEIHALVLGSVQDGGLPQTGCYTPRCNRARTKPRYVASLALIEPAAQRFYLVDATPDITRQIDLIAASGFRRRAAARRPFDGMFLTHAHIGHYLGLALLGREGLGIARTPCYSSASMATFLAENAPWSLLVKEGRLELHPLEFDRWHRIDEYLAVKLLAVPHRHEFSDTVAFVFRGPSRSLLYLPDIDGWNKWDRSVESVVSGVDAALLDGSFYSATEVPGRRHEDIPHPLIPDTMELLQGAVRAGHEIVFTHLNNTNVALDADSPERAQITQRGFDVAREGMRFEL